MKHKRLSLSSLKKVTDAAGYTIIKHQYLGNKAANYTYKYSLLDAKGKVLTEPTTLKNINEKLKECLQ